MTNIVSILLPALVMVSVTNKSVSLAWTPSTSPVTDYRLEESDDLTNWRQVAKTTNLAARVIFYGTNVSGVHHFRVFAEEVSPPSNIATITN